MSRFADLHIHTYYSDSSSSPQEVIEQAVQAGLHCIAITDHDTIDGVRPTMEIALNFDIEVVPALELSSHIDGKDVDILGYFVDIDNEVFVRQLNIIQQARLNRIDEIIIKLNGLGIKDINAQEVCALSHSNSVGRPHVAMILQKNGVVSSLQMAFEKYLGQGAPAYVPKFKQTPQEAVEVIRKAGGVAVLAHPMLTNVDEQIPSLVRAGLGGIEVFYPNVSPTVVNFYKGIAQKHKIIPTGGSDAHGAIKPYTFIGKIKLPYEYVEELKKRRG